LNQNFVFRKENQALAENVVGYADDDLIKTFEYEKIPGVMVEVPVHHFAWESYHSQENQSGTPSYPAPSIVRQLNLLKFGSQVDMLNSEKNLATMYRQFHLEYPGPASEVLYVRAEILRQYLCQRKIILVWINWGEREIDYRATGGVRNDSELQALWSNNWHVHKEFFVYDATERRAVKRNLRA
jgi:hypothetical protein